MRHFLFLFVALPAVASTITATVPQFDGPVIGPSGPFPQVAVTVGAFVYSIPAGESIVSAALAGNFGDFSGGFFNSTAPVDLHLAGETVASCTTSDPCFTTSLIPWTFTFSSTDFAQIAGGSLAFTEVQNGPTQVHLGQTTLTIITAPAVPEPETWILLAAGLLALVSVVGNPLAARRDAYYEPRP